MEYVRGASLRQVLASSRTLPVDATAALAAEVLSALALAHRVNIVHRDIKPANLLIEIGGTVKVADFGIAKSLDPAATELTADGVFVGTSAYASPEQRSGATTGPASDLYSLACVLVQCLVGSPPEVGDEADRRALLEKLDTSPTLANVPPETAEAISQAVIKALATDPPERFANADEMRATFVPYAGEESLRSLASPSLVPDPGENTHESASEDCESTPRISRTGQAPPALVNRSDFRARSSRIGTWVLVGLGLLIGGGILTWSLNHHNAAKPSSQTGTILSGGFFQPDQSIRSPNGHFMLLM